MRLTLVLDSRVKRKLLSFLYRGKNRRVKPVEVAALRARYIDYERQETNMLILRHPYLTVEQSKGHMKGLKEPMNVRAAMNDVRNEKFARTFTWAEQLSHLRVKDGWD